MEDLLHALEMMMATGMKPSQRNLDGALAQIPKDKHPQFMNRYNKLMQEYFGERRV